MQEMSAATMSTLGTLGRKIVVGIPVLPLAS